MKKVAVTFIHELPVTKNIHDMKPTKWCHPKKRSSMWEVIFLTRVLCFVALQGFMMFVKLADHPAMKALDDYRFMKHHAMPSQWLTESNFDPQNDSKLQVKRDPILGEFCLLRDPTQSQLIGRFGKIMKFGKTVKQEDSW